MAEYETELRGVLFKNDKVSENPKQPWYRGNCTVNGQEYNISAWLKEAKSGNKFLSLKMEPKETDRQQGRSTPNDDMDDSVPF